MTATVTWYPEGNLGEAGIDTLPAGAVLGQQGREPWVWVIAPDSMEVEKRTVKVGSLVNQNRIQILEGVQQGELVASAGVHHLASGMKVRQYP